MDSIYNLFLNAKNGLDINEHMPTLKSYSEQCDHITEMGVRRGVSTCALLCGKPKKMISYDKLFLDYQPQDNMPLTEYKKFAKDNNIDYDFIIEDVLDIEIEETDLLFIDTLHTYTQLKQELYLHGNKSRKYIILHDTVTFGDRGMDEKEPGLNQAIKEFLESNKEWSIKEIFYNNNGLTILQRRL